MRCTMNTLCHFGSLRAQGGEILTDSDIRQGYYSYSLIVVGSPTSLTLAGAPQKSILNFSA